MDDFCTSEIWDSNPILARGQVWTPPGCKYGRRIDAICGKPWPGAASLNAENRVLSPEHAIVFFSEGGKSGYLAGYTQTQDFFHAWVRDTNAGPTFNVLGRVLADG